MSFQLFYHRNTMSALLVGATLFGGVIGCTGRDFQSSVTSNRVAGGAVPGADEASGKGVVESENGAQLSKDSANFVKITGTTATGSAAEVLIGPGALQIDTTVAVQSYQTSDPDYIASELGLGKGKVKTVAVTEVKASTTQTLASPMTISLDIGSGTGLLAMLLTEDTYFILCTAKKASGMKKAWVIEGDDIKVEGGKVTFQTSEFGVFEVFKTPEPKPQIKKLSAGALNAFAKKISVSDLSSAALKADEALTLAGEHLSDSVKVFLGDTRLALISSDSQHLTVAVPQLKAFGPRELTIKSRYTTITKPVFYLGTRTDAPLIDLPPSEVCKGISYYNTLGEKLAGTKVCGLADVQACAAGSDSNCRLEAGQVAVDVGSLSSNDLAEGYTLLGVTGTLNHYTALKDCTEDGQVDCRSGADFYAADIKAIPSDLVKNGTRVAGVQGTFEYPSKSKCQGGLVQDCYIPIYSQDYLAVSRSLLDENLIRKGVTLGNVTGVFPSAKSPLAAESIPSLTASNFHELVSKDAPFRFFDRAGNAQLVQGDDDLKADNIASFATVLGVKGTLATIAEVKGEPKDYRVGYSFGGIQGTMKTNCRNLVLPNVGALPENNVAGHFKTEPTVNPWGDDKYACKEEGWKDYVSNCTESSSDCMFQDRKTLRMWKTGGTTNKGGALAAQSYCSTLDAHGYEDWRVPSQKEAMQAVINGISSVPHNMFRFDGGTSVYWTATIPHTESPDSPAKYWRVDMTSGFATSDDKNTESYYLCTR